MKKTRLILLVAIMLFLSMVFAFASPIFALRHVEVCFLNPLNTPQNLAQNKVFTTTQKVQKVISSGDFEFGTHMLVLSKSRHILRMEAMNPYIKILSIVSVFPNKLVVFARERNPAFCIQVGQQYMTLDDEFKILEFCHSAEFCIPITFENASAEVPFCNFFDISPLAFVEGQFLSENNLVFLAVKNICNAGFFELCPTLLTFQKTNNTSVNMAIHTGSSFGVVLKIFDIFQNFEHKFSKILNAFLTLKSVESVKTTHGILEIDANSNCFWHNL